MKKLLSVILTIFMMFTISACNNNNNIENKIENDIENKIEDNIENKIELTTSNYTKYIDVKSSISVNDFTLKTLAGVYMVNGSATLTLTVYPKQPIKCYGVQIEYTNNSPFDSLGIELTLEKTPRLSVPADGNLTEEYDIKIATGDTDELYKQIVMYQRTREKMIDSIEQPFNFNMLTDLLNVSGYVVVE